MAIESLAPFPYIILNGAKSLLIGAEWNEEKVYNKKSQKVIGRTDK